MLYEALIEENADKSPTLIDISLLSTLIVCWSVLCEYNWLLFNMLYSN